MANNPDTLILLELARRWPDRPQMLSIGTAGADEVLTRRGKFLGKAGQVPKIGWPNESIARPSAIAARLFHVFLWHELSNTPVN